MRFSASQPPSPRPSATPSRAPSPVPGRFPVLGQTLLSDKPFIARLMGGEYVVLADGRVTTPLGAKNIAGRIDLDAPNLDFNRVEVRGDALHCDAPGMLVGHPVLARPHQPGQASPLRRELMLPTALHSETQSLTAGFFDPLRQLAQAAGLAGKSNPAPRPVADRAAMAAQREILAENLRLGKPSAVKDRPYLPVIVRAYDRRHPGLNVHYVDGVQAAADQARRELAHSGPGSVRYVCWVAGAQHHIALDFRKAVDGTLTMVGIDSIDYQGRADREWLHRQLKPALEAEGQVPIKPLMMYLEVQKSEYGCGVFSLGFVKTMWKDPEAATRLHGIARDPSMAPRHAKIRNTTGDESTPFIDQKTAFAAAPAGFAKHIQSTTSMKEMWALRPSSKGEIVNASGETVKKRRDRIVQQPGLPPKPSLDKAGKAERKHFENARSADEKRLRMYDKGLADWDTGPDPDANGFP